MSLSAEQRTKIGIGQLLKAEIWYSRQILSNKPK